MPASVGGERCGEVMLLKLPMRKAEPEPDEYDEMEVFEQAQAHPPAHPSRIQKNTLASTSLFHQMENEERGKLDDLSLLLFRSASF